MNNEFNTCCCNLTINRFFTKRDCRICFNICLVVTCKFCIKKCYLNTGTCKVNNIKTCEIRILNCYYCVSSRACNVNCVVSSCCSYVFDNYVSCVLNYVECTFTTCNNCKILNCYTISAGNVNCTSCCRCNCVATTNKNCGLTDNDDFGRCNISIKKDVATIQKSCLEFIKCSNYCERRINFSTRALSVNERAYVRSSPLLCGVVVYSSCTCRCLKVSRLCAISVVEDNIYKVLRNIVVVKTAFGIKLHLFTGPCYVGVCIPCIAVYVCPFSCVFNINSYKFSCSIASDTLTGFIIVVSKCLKVFCVRILTLRASPSSCACSKTCNCSTSYLVCMVTSRSFNLYAYSCTLKSDSYCTTIFGNCKLFVRARICCTPSVVFCTLKFISACFNIVINLYI